MAVTAGFVKRRAGGEKKGRELMTDLFRAAPPGSPRWTDD
jgi:hypothetical protein